MRHLASLRLICLFSETGFSFPWLKDSCDAVHEALDRISGMEQAFKSNNYDHCYDPKAPRPLSSPFSPTCTPGTSEEHFQLPWENFHFISEHNVS